MLSARSANLYMLEFHVARMLHFTLTSKVRDMRFSDSAWGIAGYTTGDPTKGES